MFLKCHFIFSHDSVFILVYHIMCNSNMDVFLLVLTMIVFFNGKNSSDLIDLGENFAMLNQAESPAKFGEKMIPTRKQL